jgi:hypothetical protein
VKKRKEEHQARLTAARIMIMTCSPLEHPNEFSTLLNNVTSIAIQLDKISDELTELESKFFYI